MGQKPHSAKATTSNLVSVSRRDLDIGSPLHFRFVPHSRQSTCSGTRRSSGKVRIGKDVVRCRRLSWYLGQDSGPTSIYPGVLTLNLRLESGSSAG
jgi:hypothetical protein